MLSNWPPSSLKCLLSYNLIYETFINRLGYFIPGLFCKNTQTTSILPSSQRVLSSLFSAFGAKFAPRAQLFNNCRIKELPCMVDGPVSIPDFILIKISFNNLLWMYVTWTIVILLPQLIDLSEREGLKFPLSSLDLESTSHRGSSACACLSKSWHDSCSLEATYPI